MDTKALTYLVATEDYYSSLKLQNDLRTLRPSYSPVGCAYDSIELRNKLEEKTADFLLIDTMLADGKSVPVLRAAGVMLPVIFISEYGKYLQECSEFNIVGYLLKPVSPVELDSALRQLENLYRNTTMN